MSCFLSQLFFVWLTHLVLIFLITSVFIADCFHGYRPDSCRVYFLQFITYKKCFTEFLSFNFFISHSLFLLDDNIRKSGCCHHDAGGGSIMLGDSLLQQDQGLTGESQHFSKRCKFSSWWLPWWFPSFSVPMWNYKQATSVRERRVGFKGRATQRYNGESGQKSSRTNIKVFWIKSNI